MKIIQKMVVANTKAFKHWLMKRLECTAETMEMLHECKLSDMK